MNVDAAERLQPESRSLPPLICIWYYRVLPGRLCQGSGRPTPAIGAPTSTCFVENFPMLLPKPTSRFGRLSLIHLPPNASLSKLSSVCFNEKLHTPWFGYPRIFCILGFWRIASSILWAHLPLSLLEHEMNPFTPIFPSFWNGFTKFFRIQNILFTHIALDGNLRELPPSDHCFNWTMISNASDCSYNTARYQLFMYR